MSMHHAVQEEDNKFYFLLKPITDNVSYYIYGQWESAEGYAEVCLNAGCHLSAMHSLL